MLRPYNFSPGPAAVPQAVLERAQAELLDWQGSGVSVMEVSHRGKAFMSFAAQAEADLRELLVIPDNYKVLFLQGGATMQFAMAPINLLRGRKSADYICTGSWSKKAIKEAQRFCQVNVAASSENDNFTSIPSYESWRCNTEAAYLHYTPNETIHGVEFSFIPDSNAPLVADMSSTLLSRPLDVSRFGLIYAGAQKNLGIAGLTVVIVRDDLLGQALPASPSLFDYKLQADSDSMSNTPTTFAWYMAGLVFQWLKQLGGLHEMAKRNQAKAELLYSAIDGSNYYHNPVAMDCRSWMNVPFTLPDESLDKVFLVEAEEAGLLALKGHRSVGGMRASLYNAMSEDGVRALVDFMSDFSRRYG